MTNRRNCGIMRLSQRLPKASSPPHDTARGVEHDSTRASRSLSRGAGLPLESGIATRPTAPLEARRTRPWRRGLPLSCVLPSAGRHARARAYPSRPTGTHPTRGSLAVAGAPSANGGRRSRRFPPRGAGPSNPPTRRDRSRGPQGAAQARAGGVGLPGGATFLEGYRTEFSRVDFACRGRARARPAAHGS